MDQQTNQNKPETKTPAPDATNPDTQNAQTNPQASSAAGDQLLNELDRLGNQLVGVLRAAWNSDHRKQLEDELGKGVKDVIGGIDAGVKRISESESARTILNKAEDALNQAGEQLRSSKVTHDVADGLRKGLQSINEQLAKFAQDMQKGEAGKTPAQPKAEAPAQEIRVEKEG